MIAFPLLIAGAALARDVSPSTDTGPSTAPTSAPPWALVVSIWRGEAEAQGLASEHIRLYEQYMRDAFSQGDISFPCQEATAYRQAVRRFLAAHRKCLKSAPAVEATGTIRWLAWCTLNACERRPLSPAERESLAAEYNDLFAGVLAEARRRMIGSPPVPLSAEGRKTIEEALENSRRVFDRRVRELQEDFLYPALKAPLTDAQRSEVLRCLQFGRAETQPVPSMPMSDREHAYVRGALSYIHHYDDSALFYILGFTMEAALPRSRWGTFLGGANGHSTEEHLSLIHI